MSEEMIQSFAANVLRLGNEVRDLAKERDALKEHIKYLEIELKCETGRWERVMEENARLRASSFVTAVPVEQYERLLKAGDNLEYLLTSKIMSYEVGNASFEWNAAKEGKPSV